MASSRQPAGPGIADKYRALGFTRLLDDLGAIAGEESTRMLFERGGVRIERIVSLAYASPANFWYEQECHEWVMVIAGCGEVEFDDGRTVRLEPGDSLDLPARRRHRVSYTDPESPTVWVAVRIDPD